MDEEIGFCPQWDPGNACKTGCDGKGMVQNWSWPLTPSLGCQGEAVQPTRRKTDLVIVGKKKSEF